MQLILSIDNIGIKNNMSSAQETNRIEKEVKSPLIDKILSYSISSTADDSVEKEDQIVQESQNSSNGTVAEKEDQNVQDQQNSCNGTVAEKEDQIVQDSLDASNSGVAEKEDQIVQDNQNSSNVTVVKEEDQIVQDNQNLCNGTVSEKEDQIVQDNLDASNGVVAEKEDQILQDKQNSCNVTVVKEEDQIVQDNENSSKGTVAKEEDQIAQDNQNASNDTGAEEEDEIVEDNLNSSNGTDEEASSLDALDKSQENSKTDLCETTNIENDNHVIQTGDDESENISTEIKTDFEEDEEQEKSEEKSAEKQSEVNCDKNNDADIQVYKSEIQHLDESHLDNIESICKKYEDDRKAQKVDLKQNDNVEEELKMVHERQLEDFETVSIENNVSENAANDSLEDKEDNGNDSKKIEPTTLISDDIIDIADEKDSCDGTELENKIVGNKPLDKDTLNESTENSKETILKKNFEDLKKSNHISVFDEPIESSNLDKSNSSQEAQENIQNVEDKNNLKVNSDSLQGDKTDPTNKLMNFKLSNMLDILSDDEDNHTNKPESSKQEPDEPASSNKQCINIEEDDDIMLIDDESTTKENETTENNAEKTNRDSEEVKDVVDQVESKQDLKEDTIKNLENDDSGLEDSSKVKDTEKLEPEVKTTEKSPLLSTTTLKSFKKNLAEMTREELEDFCILKIVESVFDKSNLGEIKAQIKVMAQNIDEYKTKAKILTKQNRDLQVVLKSVQEEQKKNSSPITPLKITRSVGMQVLMTDKNSRKRQNLPSQSQLNSNINSLSTTNNNKTQNKSQVNPNTRYAKPQQPIPVPRLIPAVNVGTKSGPNSSPQAVNNPGKSSTVNNIANGVKPTPPAIRPEKRSHTKMQQNNSDTVDLTDDEPPAKVNNNNRNFNPSVRCVPPQSLLAPQRSPLPQNINSPKKVYIPISGPQSQNIRPGQTIMLKSVPTAGTGTRPRGPSNNMKIAPNTQGAVRNARTVQRHPAPLPEFTKQYQPPNWKALPPAPELKLAKVENGIVISWKIDGYREENHEEIASYQLFAYQETSSPPNTSLWKKIGDVKALPLPMACTLTQFMSGYKYYFAVRAVDVRSRFGPFSLPGSILLLKNQ